MVKALAACLLNRGYALFYGFMRMLNPQTATQAKPREANYGWMHQHRWHTLHKRYCDTRQAPMDILFIGDSITEGWGDTHVWQEYFGRYAAEKFGIGGDCTQNLLWRINAGELDAVSPSLVVILIGTNNFGLFNHSVESTAQGIALVVENVKLKLPQSKILLLGIFPRDKNPGTKLRKKILACNQVIASLDNGEDIFFLDIGEVFLQQDGSISDDIMHDYLHLTDNGYRHFAEALRPTISTLLQ